MKKFFKVFKVLCIILLIGGVIAGTCFIFFKNMKKREDPISFIDYLYSEEKDAFDADLFALNNTLVLKFNDHRLGWLNNTAGKLDLITEALGTYVIQNGGYIDDTKVVNSFQDVRNARSYARTMINEYKVKINKQTVALGFNDLYEQLCVYIEEYARLTRALNTYVVDLGYDKSSDLKFNMIDLYSNIAINTFSKVIVADGQLSNVENNSNINKVNDIFALENNQIVTSSSKFSKNVNEFDRLYSLCDKASFAKNFVLNLGETKDKELSTLTSNELKATYYLRSFYTGV